MQDIVGTLKEVEEKLLHLEDCLWLVREEKENKVYCFTSDGEQDEGNTWEGVMFAAKYKLNNLVCLMDYNKIQLSGNVKEIMPLGNLKKKYKSFGWNVKVINGHNFKQIEKSLNIKFKKPLMIICKTIPGKGVDFMEREFSWHGIPPNKEQADKALHQLRTLEGKIKSEHE